MRLPLLLMTILGITSCTKDRLIVKKQEKTPTQVDSATQVSKGTIVINEYVARGSTLMSNLGLQSDWIEFYNTQDTAVLLKAEQWYITDNLSQPTKFELPELSIPAKGYYVIFCEDTVYPFNGEVHTTFGLSSGGEEIGLFYKPGDSAILMDSTRFGPQTQSGKSGARIPDGSSNWQYPSEPTPRNSNQ